MAPSALSADDGAVHPLAAVAFGVATVAVFTATAFALTTAFTEREQPPPEADVETEVHRTDEGGSWIELWLRKAPQGPIPSDEITVTAQQPDGSTSTAVCGKPGWTAEEGACQQPFVDRAWARGDGLWIPCASQGVHVVTVTVGDTVVHESAEECLGPAPALAGP